VNRESVYR